MLEERKEIAFWNKPVKRRDFAIGTAGVTAIGTLIYLARDYAESEEETLSRFQLSERVTGTLDFMRQVDLTPPQDRLYTFTYPSTREVAERYLDRFIPYYQTFEAESTLFVFEESRTSYFFRRVKQAIGLEPTVPEEVGGYVIRAIEPGEIDGLYLNPSFQLANSAERALILYHEGLHLFYQPPITENFLFQESMPNIGGLLLTQQYMDNKYLVRRINYKLQSAYQKAVSENNPRIWEQAVKEVYGVN